jgi:antitoxin ParD1/3/4
MLGTVGLKGSEESMNVNLPRELERLVQRRVKTGRYNSASEVVREALRLLDDQ